MMRFFKHVTDLDAHTADKEHDEYTWDAAGPLGIEVCAMAHNPKRPAALKEPHGVMITKTPAPETGWPEWIDKGMQASQQHPHPDGDSMGVGYLQRQPPMLTP